MPARTLTASALLLILLSGPAFAAPSQTLQTDHFRITYKARGGQAPPRADRDGDGIPDYVEWVAEAAELTHTFLTDRGWPAPPGYNRRHRYRANGRVEIAIRRLNYEGYTEPLAWIGDNPFSTDAVEWDAWLARVVVTNDFVALGYPSQKEYVQLFVTHELMHLTLAGTTWGSTGHLDCAHEWVASWMESQVYPGVYNNQDYLPYYFAATDVPLLKGDAYDYDACYGMWIFAQYVSDRLGHAAIRDFWLTTRHQEITDSLDVYQALDQAVGGLPQMYAGFTAWLGQRLFTSGTQPAAEGSIVAGVHTGWRSDVEGDGALPALAVDYLRLQNGSGYQVSVQSTNGTAGLFGYVLIQRSGSATVETHPLTPGQPLSLGSGVTAAVIVVGNHGAADGLSYEVVVSP